jgi:hypothetical protein
MVVGIVALALTVVGAVLIGIGVWVSLDDRRKKLRREEQVTPQPTSGVDLGGLAKLADALGKQPLGLQLIIVGMGLMLAGGLIGGVDSVS